MKSLVIGIAVMDVMGLGKTMAPAPTSYDFISRTCAQWTLSTQDVQSFFAHADKISSEEWHRAYDVTPCRYEGTVAIDGKRYRFEINGGSWGVLIGTSPEGASYYGCKDRCAKLFPFHLYGDE
jgi:hypothetical protein